MADLRAATPSNAAELAVPNAEDIRETLRGYDIRMAQAMRKQMTQRRAALENLAGRRVLQSPAAYFDLRRVELDYTRSRLTAAGERWLAARRHDFARCAAALDAMSPLKVLARGCRGDGCRRCGAPLGGADTTRRHDPRTASGRCVALRREQQGGCPWQNRN
ncbi:MAG: exodeoxyribonuclease VII large subunit [Oscillospiraceae bacterium]